MTLNHVREALRDALKAQLPNWSVYPHVQAVTSIPVNLGAVVITPSTDVEIPSAEYQVNLARSVKWYIDVIVLTPYQSLPSAIRLLDAAVSPDDPNSIPSILTFKRSPSLKETFNYIRVTKMREYGGTYGVGNVEHIGACIKVEVEEICRPTA